MRSNIKKIIKMNKSKEDEEKFESAKLCWICEKTFLMKSQYAFLYLIIGDQKKCPKLGEN